MTISANYNYYLFLGAAAPVAGTTQFVILSANRNGASNDLVFTGSTLATNGTATWQVSPQLFAAGQTSITYTGFTTTDGGPIIEVAPSYQGGPGQYYALSNTLSTSLTPVAEASFACFVSGTRIATPAGERAVETLRVGQKVTLAGGGCAAIAWIGWRTLEQPAPDARAVRIRAHSFGPGRPRRDLYLSAAHAVFRNGVLIPVKALIDGHAIAQVDLGPLAYFHILLERHEIILAEGLECETLLDVDSSETFANVETAPPSLAWLRPAAPIVRQGPALEQVRAEVRRRQKVLI